MSTLWNKFLILFIFLNILKIHFSFAKRSLHTIETHFSFQPSSSSSSINIIFIFIIPIILFFIFTFITTIVGKTTLHKQWLHLQCNVIGLELWRAWKPLEIDLSPRSTNQLDLAWPIFHFSRSFVHFEWKLLEWLWR